MRLYYTPEKCKWVVGWRKLYKTNDRDILKLDHLWRNHYTTYAYKPLVFIRAVCNASSGG